MYGKTIDHVIEQEVALSDGSVVTFGPVSDRELDGTRAGDTLEARCYRVVAELAEQHRDEIDRRFPKVLRRVGGYNLDALAASVEAHIRVLLLAGREEME